MGEPRPQISVVIPTFNRVNVLAECLQLLCCQTIGARRFEVLVCDDGSTDGTTQLLQTFSPPYKLTSLRQPNAGPAAARNSAIKRARAPIVLILNDDTFLRPDVLQLHLRRHQEYQDDHISVLGPCEIDPLRIDDYFTNLVDQMHLVLCHHALGPGQTRTNFTHFFTCNISVPKHALLEVGLFDESFFKGCEDIELGYRLQKAGWGVLYDPSIRSSHHHLQTPESFCEMITTRATGHILIWDKHPEIEDIELGLSTLNGAIFERALRNGKDVVISQLRRLIKAELNSINRTINQISTGASGSAEPGSELQTSLRENIQSLHLYASFCGRLESPLFSRVAKAANPQIMVGFPPGGGGGEV
jgi:GT2 family glycosyltransferase